MNKFRKKPVVIEATQWLGPGTPHPQVREFTDVEAPTGERGRFYVETLEGPLRVSPGDWIIRGVRGEFYPCKPDIFAATYEPAAAPAGAASAPDWDALDAYLREEISLERLSERLGCNIAEVNGLSSVLGSLRAENGSLRQELARRGGYWQPLGAPEHRADEPVATLHDALVDAEELLTLIDRGVTPPDNVWQDHIARVRAALAMVRL